MLGSLINYHSGKTVIRQLPCLDDMVNTLWNKNKKTKIVKCHFFEFHRYKSWKYISL